MKALRLMLLGEVRGLVVTTLDFDAPDGLSLDADIAKAAGLLEHEKVDVLVSSNGSRLACRLSFAPAGSRTCGVGGAAAHFIKPGDTLSLSSFGHVKSRAALKHEPTVVTVSGENELP